MGMLGPRCLFQEGHHGGFNKKARSSRPDRGKGVRDLRQVSQVEGHRHRACCPPGELGCTLQAGLGSLSPPGWARGLGTECSLTFHPAVPQFPPWHSGLGTTCLCPDSSWTQQQGGGAQVLPSPSPVLRELQ